MEPSKKHCPVQLKRRGRRLDTPSESDEEEEQLIATAEQNAAVKHGPMGECRYLRNITVPRT